MNVMKEAHKAVREAFAKVGHGVKLEYRPLFRAALIDLHAKHKRQCEALQTGCRNLYKVIDGASPTQTVVAFLTAPSFEKANIRYQSNGGKVRAIKIEQLSWGYPQEELRIFA